MILTSISFPPIYFNGIAMKNNEIVEMVSRIPLNWKKFNFTPPPLVVMNHKMGTSGLRFLDSRVYMLGKV